MSSLKIRRKHKFTKKIKNNTKNDTKKRKKRKKSTRKLKYIMKGGGKHNSCGFAVGNHNWGEIVDGISSCKNRSENGNCSWEKKN